jgi:hypothetical protein
MAPHWWEVERQDIQILNRRRKIEVEGGRGVYSRMVSQVDNESISMQLFYANKSLCYATKMGACFYSRHRELMAG